MLNPYSYSLTFLHGHGEEDLLVFYLAPPAVLGVVCLDEIVINFAAVKRSCNTFGLSVKVHVSAARNIKSDNIIDIFLITEATRKANSRKIIETLAYAQ